MLFNYQAIDKENQRQDGSIDAPNIDMAIAGLQRRGLVILDIKSAEERSWLSRYFFFGRKPKFAEIVMLSRQISTLFEAKVSALDTFRLLAAEADNPILRRILAEVADDVNAGVAISAALAKHSEVFSDLYVNMVRAGEESGKMAEAFSFLAAYLERYHALISKAKNALIYPAFIIASFILVMVLMMVFVIPRLSEILVETGQEIPIYTKIVIGISGFFVNYGIFLLIIFAIALFFLNRYVHTDAGKISFASFKLSLPYLGSLFQKLYLSRVADNLSTMLTSGISMVRALEITAEVVGSEIYKQVFKEISVAVGSGSPLSAIMFKYPEIPTMVIQMIKVGEETGKLGFILDTISRFYQREVYNEVDTLVDLIEPALIVFLGLGVGILLTSVLVPIYNLASGI